MKKLLLSFLFIAAAFITQAQDKKPTKEECQKFINSMLSQAIGQRNASMEDFTITQQYFNEGFDSYTMKDDDGEANSTTSLAKVTLIKWETLRSCDDDITANKNTRIVYLRFDSEIQRTHKVDNGRERKYFTSKLELYVPSDKVESVKKACLRLAEIAKEENKDPFAN